MLADDQISAGPAWHAPASSAGSGDAPFTAAQQRHQAHVANDELMAMCHALRAHAAADGRGDVADDLG